MDLRLYVIKSDIWASQLGVTQGGLPRYAKKLSQRIADRGLKAVFRQSDMTVEGHHITACCLNPHKALKPTSS